MYKLGRKPRVFNPRVPHFSALIAGRRLAAPPVSVNYLNGMPASLGMMLNDSLGDCLVGETLTAAPGLVKAYRIPYDGPIVTIVTSTGKRLTSTRNHMVLTNRGFVAAYLLQNGDYVVSTDFPQAIACGIDNNFNNAPTRIEDVFQTCERISLSTRKERQVRCSIDFHGDAQFFKSEIDVVDANSLMQRSNVTSLCEPEGKESFIAVSLAHALDGERTSLAHDHSIGFSSPDALCFGGESTLLVGSPFVRPQLRSFGRRPHLHASSTQRGIQSFPTDPELFGELSRRFPSEITLDRIVQVEHGSHSGCVYDLSTAPQWYIANGILTHNCTCAGIYHARQVWSATTGHMVTDPDSDVLAVYEAFCGYNPSDPSTDQGGVEQTVLADWLTSGIPIGTGRAVNKLSAWVEVDPRNINDVKRVIDACGVAYIGFDVPANIMPEDGPSPAVWTVSPGAQILGGHAIVLAGYDADLVHLISWGGKYSMTWPFFSQYTDEVYALIDADWVTNTGQTPLAMTLAELTTQMDGLKMAA